MNSAAEALRREVRRVLLFQASFTLLVAAGFGYGRGWQGFLSAGYGGAAALLLTAWLGRGVQRASGLGSIYANTLTRYAAAIVILGLGMAALKLAPPPLILAFAVAQFGCLVLAPRAQAGR